MAIYDLTDHPQLDEAVPEQGAEYLDFQTRVAEAVLGATEPPFSDAAGQAARDALVLQVNYQEATGVDARMLTGSTRAGVSFRSNKAGDLPPADPLALIMWSRAVVLAAGDGIASEDTLLGVEGWHTVRSLRR